MSVHGVVAALALPLSTTPNYIIPKGNTIYVRGYDSDFVFEAQSVRSP